MKLAAAMLMCLVLASGLVVPARAAPAVQMLARAGFDGAGKAGGWVPVDIDLRNDGDDLDGEIQIVIQDGSANRGTYTLAPTVYSAPVVLPRRGRKHVRMEVRLPANSQKVRARLVQGEETLLEQDIQFTRVSGGDLLCGILSRTASALEFLSTLDLPPPLRRARLARIDVGDIPSRPQLMGSLDCLVIDNIPTTALTDTQRDALRTWVANGGLLVVGGGGSWQKTFEGLPSDLLPVRVTNTATVDDLSGLAAFAREAPPADGQYLASQAVITDGNSVVEQNGVPLLVGTRRGSGAVFYLGLDPAAEPLRSWPGSATIWRYILSHASTSQTLAPGGSTPFSNWGRIPRNALVDISPLAPPSPAPLVAILGLYALLVGPGNYLLLRRLGSPTWSLVTVPLLTLIAGLLAFGVAGANRDSDAILTKVSLVRALPDTPIAYSRTYAALLSRQQTSYDIAADEGSLILGQFYPFPRDPSSEGPAWNLKVLTGPNPAVSGLTLQAGSLGTFAVDGSFRTHGGLEADLTTDGRSLFGTITNRTGHPISDAALVLDYNVTRLGDIKPDETKDVSMALQPGASAGYGPPNSFASLLYPGTGARRRPSDVARRDILDSVFGQTFNYARLDLYGLTLLGWLETSGADLDVRPSRPASIENTLYLASLPVRFPKGYEGEIPAPLVTHRPLGATTASRQQYGTYDLAPGESIALQFTLPMHPGRFLIERLTLNLEGRLRGPGAGSSDYGTVQLFNWRTTDWEELAVQLGPNLISNPRDYVSSTGDVRLRYTLKTAPDSGVTGASFTRFDITAAGLVR